MFELDMEGGVARLVLSRPQARNAIPASSWAELAAAAERAGQEGARLLLLSGKGEAFCAGADISDFPAMAGDEEAAGRFRQAMRGALDRVAALAIPTIAAIHGPCFGAGVALAMACDLRIAGAGARFAITPAKFGISYPQEDVHRLVALVGPGQAARLLFGGEGIDGAEAARIGLVEIDAGAGLAEAVGAITSAILANSADSLRTLKRGLALAARGNFADEGQDRDFDRLLGSPDLAARLAALRAGRAG